MIVRKCEGVIGVRLSDAILGKCVNFIFSVNSLISAYQAFWTRAFDFSGRTRRIDFWLTVLVNLVVTIVLAIIAGFVDFLQILSGLFSFAVIIPSFSMVVRRLRDAGKEWPWLFILLVPFVGAIWLLVIYCAPSIPA